MSFGDTPKKVQQSPGSTNVSDMAGKAREYARSDPGLVLGGR